MKNTSPRTNRERITERFIEKFYREESKKLLPEQVKAIKKFDRQNSGNDMSILTRKNYITVLKQLAGSIRKPFEKMTKEDLGIFLDKVNKAYHPTTAQQKKIQIKKFFKFVYNTEEFPEVVGWISIRKSQRHSEPSRKILSIDERKALLDACRNQRDRAILTFLDHTGCRADELTNTKIKDIQPDKNGRFMTITLGKGKTGRRRIAITEGLSDIQSWLNMHPFKHNPDASFLVSFSPRDHLKAMQPWSLNGILDSLAMRAGIERKVHTHLFRHTRIWISKKVKSWNEDQMRVFFGWVKGSVMPSYYGHLSEDDVNEKILVEAGIKSQTEMEETEIKDMECPRCHSKNPFDAKYCNICSLVLDSEIVEKHIRIMKASDSMMDMAHEKNIKVKELVEKHMEEVRDKVIEDLGIRP